MVMEQETEGGTLDCVVRLVEALESHRCQGRRLLVEWGRCATLHSAEDSTVDATLQELKARAVQSMYKGPSESSLDSYCADSSIMTPFPRRLNALVTYTHNITPGLPSTVPFPEMRIALKCATGGAHKA